MQEISEGSTKGTGPNSRTVPDSTGEEIAGQRESLGVFRRNHKNLLPESWRVRVPIFEGPLDLLLHLIRVNRVDIANIPVALICAQYQEYLGLMDELDLDIAGEYLYEAALLIQIKSQMLLPRPAAVEGDEPPEDARDGLVRRLLEYQRIKEAAQILAEVDSVRRGLWTRSAQEILTDDGETGEMDLGDLSSFDLLSVFRGVLKRYDQEHPDPLVLRGESFSIRDQIERILSSLTPSQPLDFVDDLLALSCRGEAIAAFLAVLELGCLQLVRLHPTADGILLYRTTRELVRDELESIIG